MLAPTSFGEEAPNSKAGGATSVLIRSVEGEHHAVTKLRLSCPGAFRQKYAKRGVAELKHECYHHGSMCYDGSMMEHEDSAEPVSLQMPALRPSMAQANRGQASAMPELQAATVGFGCEEGSRKTLTSSWKSGDPLRHFSLPDRPATYALLLNGRFLYIGSTESVRKRMSQHNIRYSYGGAILTPWGHCQTVTLRYRTTLKFGEWLMREARLIRRLQPVLNCQLSTRKRNTDRSVKKIRNVPTIEVKFSNAREYVPVFASVEEYLAGERRRDGRG